MMPLPFLISLLLQLQYAAGENFYITDQLSFHFILFFIYEIYHYDKLRKCIKLILIQLSIIFVSSQCSGNHQDEVISLNTSVFDVNKSGPSDSTIVVSSTSVLSKLSSTAPLPTTDLSSPLLSKAQNIRGISDSHQLKKSRSLETRSSSLTKAHSIFSPDTPVSQKQRHVASLTHTTPNTTQQTNDKQSNSSTNIRQTDGSNISYSTLPSSLATFNLVSTTPSTITTESITEQQLSLTTTRAISHSENRLPTQPMKASPWVSKLT